MGFGRQTYSVEQALAKMQYYCAYQERCHHEIRQKLISMHMIPQAIDQITVVLINEGYLNEERFTRTFISGKFRIKKWGKNRIIRELKKRGISDFNIKLGLKEISENIYQSTFYDLFEKRKKELKELSKVDQKKKIFYYFSYRGWEHSKIYEALAEL
jgi:regulatory protein